MDYYYNDLIVFSLGKEVCEKWTYYVNNYSFKIESGGVIVGKLNPAEKQIIATDLTEPQIKDKCTTLTFKRSEYGHQKIMDKLWEESEYAKTYIGEWHTHKQRVPQPSFIDRNNWIQISKRKHNSEWLFFVIVGTEQIRVWTVSNGEIVQMVLLDK